jgi:hypothetical protein
MWGLKAAYRPDLGAAQRLDTIRRGALDDFSRSIGL